MAWQATRAEMAITDKHTNSQENVLITTVKVLWIGIEKTFYKLLTSFILLWGTLLRVMQRLFKFAFFCKKFCKTGPRKCNLSSGESKNSFFFVTFTSIFLAQRCMLGVTRGPAWNQVSML
jgi:hypothetical protein